MRIHISLRLFSLSGVRSLVLCVILTILIRPYSLHLYSLLETYIFFLLFPLDAAGISHRLY
jgi:hypothetical protein